MDGDGFDEITYGASAIDHNGKGLYSTGLGHGDMLHVGKFIADRPGLQCFQCFETAVLFVTPQRVKYFGRWCRRWKVTRDVALSLI